MAEQEEEEGVLEWRRHPMAETPVKSALLLLFLIALGIGVHWLYADPVLTGISFVITIGALSRYFFPTTYRLDSEGASERTLIGKRLLSWNRVRRVDEDKNGVFLSPFPRPSRLDSYRGLYLLSMGEQRAAVARAARERAAARDDGNT